MKIKHYFFSITLILTIVLISGSGIFADKKTASEVIVEAAELSYCHGEDSGDFTQNLNQVPINLSKTDSRQMIEKLLKTMTLQEKVGQMVQTDIAAATPADIEKYNLGSIISLIPKGDLKSAGAWREVADKYQKSALATRLSLPLVFAIDAVHGHSYFDGPSVILPHNIGLGATRNPELVKQLAALTARELSATGVRWTFSPTIAVARNIRWGRTYESFGETTELQRMFASAMVEGYQGNGVMSEQSVGATAKHFVADGATQDGVDRGNAIISDSELRQIHLPGFIDAIESDVMSIMVSFSSVNGEKLHGSKKLLTGLLKNELGFKGVVITDWEGVQTSGLSLKQGLEAGIDMFMFAQSWKTSMPEIIRLVEQKEVPISRIDDAVYRILMMKLKLGLFQRPFSSSSCDKALGSTAHRQIARQAVRESLVLLKNDKGILPLDKKQPVLVVGSHANNLAYQCGGWTKKWQGAQHDRFNNPERPIDGATSVINGIQELIGKKQVIDAGTNGISEQADTVIIVVGETPYAEAFGDKKPSELVLSEAQKSLIESYKKSGKKVVTVLISGRPLLINESLALSDAFVAAWLPGSEAQGIADVLFGDYNFRGRLGFTWPKDATQIPFDKTLSSKALFDYGFGLTY